MSLCSTVISYVPFDIKEEKPGLIPPYFFIKASDMIVPSLLRVETGTHFVYLDESRGSLQVKDPSDLIARSIVEDYCSSQLGISDGVGPAIFWVPEEISLASFRDNHELKIVSEKKKLAQRAWFLNIVRVADDDWNKYHKHTVVSDFQRRLAEVLDLDPKEHEWMTPLSILNDTSKTCPFCMSSIPKEAVVCLACNNVVDPKRKKELEESLLKG